jgi:hypothetical protein
MSPSSGATSCALLCCAALQFSLLEYFGPNGNPIGQFIVTVDASNPLHWRE